MNQQTGFTLIELMVAVMVVAILAAIALPSYQEYIRRQNLAIAKQEMMVIAGELERFKGKNFSYTGFNDEQLRHIYDTKFASGKLETPTDKTSKHYTIKLTIANTGLGWHMTAIRKDDRNYNVGMTSAGTRCQTEDDMGEDDNNCGTNSESW